MIAATTAGLSFAQPGEAVIKLASLEDQKALAPLSNTDVNGDGVADLANPTGHALRGEDAYASCAFGASRADGRRLHRGVDYIAEPGEVVRAPVNGPITATGRAYKNDCRYLFVEVCNPLWPEC